MLKYIKANNLKPGMIVVKKEEKIEIFDVELGNAANSIKFMGFANGKIVKMSCKRNDSVGVIE